MLGLGIILAHLLGDYVLQNDWMANEKTKRWTPAAVHGLIYSLPYYLLIIMMLPWPTFWGGATAWVIIWWTHVVIDRYRLVKPLIWAINQLAPRASRYSWAEAKANGGYSANKPAWMSTWLMIIVDNTVHLLINTAAIYFLVAHA